MIRGLVPKERLLEWAVEDGWEPLCEFLDKPVPNEPFPHVNTGAGWAGHEMELGKRYVVGAAQTLAIICAITVATGAAVYRYWF